MDAVTLYVPEEFAIESDTLEPRTRLALMLRTVYNPVPALAVMREFLSAEGVEISDEIYDEAIGNTMFLAASSHWEEFIVGSFRKDDDGIMPNAEKVYPAHRVFITMLVNNLRDEGHDIPVQSWEAKPESSETKEES